MQRLRRMRMLAKLPEQEEPTSYLRALAQLEARQRKRSLVIVLTDFTDEVSAQELYASLAALARRHVLVFAAVADAHLARIFEEPEFQDEAALFQRAAAGELLLERGRTLAGIERLGVIAVDAEPRQLSGPLIRRYPAARRWPGVTVARRARADYGPRRSSRARSSSSRCSMRSTSRSIALAGSSFQTSPMSQYSTSSSRSGNERCTIGRCSSRSSAIASAERAKSSWRTASGGRVAPAGSRGAQARRSASADIVPWSRGSGGSPRARESARQRTAARSARAFQYSSAKRLR
jgi:hypothetical protein